LEIKGLELKKTREQYSQLRVEILSREELLQGITKKLTEIEGLLQGLIPAITQDTIRELKRENVILQSYIENEPVPLKKFLQDKTYTPSRK